MARILVLVGGSVAALKAPSLLRRLVEAGHTPRVVATASALRFVTELSLAAAAGSAVASDVSWFRPDGAALHLSLAEGADLAVVVAASADLIARAALGRSSDLASAALLSLAAPVLWAPAMNTRMWEHPLTQAHLEVLRGLGHRLIGPVSGPLGTAGEPAGMGRMAEEGEILGEVARLLAPGDLSGYRLLVTAGPTREYLDPVRFLSNPSSGKMGYALAERAAARGAEVVLISGPVALGCPPAVRRVMVETALEMRAALRAELPGSAALLMAAAVADYRAAEPATQKRPKGDAPLTLELVPNPDILAELDQAGLLRLGFAMETAEDGLERARAKLERKRLDFLALNYPTREESPFGGDYNQITLLASGASPEEWPRLPKREVADRLLDRVSARLGG